MVNNSVYLSYGVLDWDGKVVPCIVIFGDGHYESQDYEMRKCMKRVK